MAESGLSYREVTQTQSFSQRWKEITIQTGGRPGSLQDVKLPEVAGGYAYRDSGLSGSPARNRFIYWRVQGDTLELVEESLDFTLSGSSVRFRFLDTPILNGISIHESHGHVVILVATVGSVHRLIFPHPTKLARYDQAYLHSTNRSMLSIFSDVSVKMAQQPSNSHFINMTGGPAYHVHAAAAWLTNEDESLFALATNLGSILLIKMPPYGIQGVVTQTELRQASMMQRLWTGLVSAVVKSGAEAGMTRSLCIHPLGQDVFVFAVCQDHKLRMWSCRTQDCVLVSDMLDYVPGNLDPQKVTVGGEGHQIRKSVGSTSQFVNLGVFLSFNDRCQYCVFQPILADGCYQLSHLTTVFCPENEMVDFTLTSSHLWALWTNVEGEAVTQVTDFTSVHPGSRSQWMPVFMDHTVPGQLEVPPHQDPRDAYLSFIFHPGNFSSSAIVRALHIFRRSLDSSYSHDSDVSLELLKLEVTAAVEHEIRNAASDYEMDSEDYYNLQLTHWAKFYSFCSQYQDVANKPVGIFADSTTGMVAIVKKMYLSTLRPCHLVEHLYLTPADSGDVADIKAGIFLTLDDEVCQDVMLLCDCIKTMGSLITPEMAYAFEQDMYHTQSPQDVAKQLVNNMLTDCGNLDQLPWQQEIEVHLQGCRDIIKAADVLLQILDLSRAWPDGVFVDDIVMETSRQLSCSHLFASGGSLGILARCVSQLADTGFLLSRDLLLLMVLLSRMGQQANLQLQTTEQIQCELLTRTASMTQAYFLLKWTGQCLASHVDTETQDHSQRQLDALEWNEAVATPIMHKLVGQTVSLLELFLHGQGGTQTRSILAQSTFFDEDPCALWDQVLLPTSTVIAQLIWPLNANFLFPESLACQCQYQQLQEYVRLTRDWCETNASSRKFMLGLSYLNTNEPQKAVDVMMEAVPSISNEDFLVKLLRPEASSPSQLEVLYYLKVIRLFEQFSFPHLVVTLATTAVSVAEDDDPHLATLWSKVFKHQLELGHNEQAYTAMVANPDASRRKDCLRQLLVVLCERGELQQLVEFPYVDLQDEVVSILESRARAVDLSKHNFYDLLYSFHVFRGNYRKAGSVMYENGMRLGREVPGLRGLQRQARCYLAAMNALRLVDPNYAWIVKPAKQLGSHMIMDDEMGGKSPKHMFDGDEKEDQPMPQVEVLELAELQKEYLLVDARLRLLKVEPDPSHMVGPTCSAGETVALLVNAGLFDVAISVCQLFDLPLTPMFEELAGRCVTLAQQSSDFMVGGESYQAQAWDWLNQNDIGPVSSKDSSATDEAWRLLQSYLDKHTDRGSRYHKCIAIRLITQGFQLPSWFIASYKLVNAPELLRIYLDYDLLEEAAYLSMEYVDAVMGRGSEYFNLKCCLRFGSPSVWLPYTSLDQLVSALKDAQSDTIYMKLYRQLTEKLDHYFNTLQSVTGDTVQAAAKNAAINATQFGSGIMMES